MIVGLNSHSDSAMTVSKMRQNKPGTIRVKNQSEEPKGKKARKHPTHQTTLNDENPPTSPPDIHSTSRTPNIPSGPAKLPSSLLPLVLVISWYRGPKAFPVSLPHVAQAKAFRVSW